MNFNNLSTADVTSLRTAVKKIMDGCSGILTVLDALQTTEYGPLDPKNPRNKEGEKLTDIGVEILYRMFDAGMNRNQARMLMDISYKASTHRYAAWQKLGGANRPKMAI